MTARSFSRVVDTVEAHRRQTVGSSYNESRLFPDLGSSVRARPKSTRPDGYGITVGENMRKLIRVKRQNEAG